MQLDTPEACRAYVEVQLQQLTRSHVGWHSGRSTAVPERPLTWTVGRGVGEGWYTLEARLADREFLIWFGTHRVGAEGLHWIMRPAVHVAFADLSPRGDPIAIHFSLCDVIAYMISTLSLPQRVVAGFSLNSFSNT
jgi:hypothetical protein